MAELLVRQGTQWVNVCDKDVHFRNVETGEWIKFKSGDAVRLPFGTWLPILCVAPVECGQQSTYVGGRNYPTPAEVKFNFGNSTGIVDVMVRAGELPDKFEIWYNDIKVADSGYIGDKIHNTTIANATNGEQVEHIGYRILSFNKNLPGVTTATLKVYSPLSGTQWETLPACPGVNVPYVSFDIENNIQFQTFRLNILNTGTGMKPNTTYLTGNRQIYDNHTDTGSTTFEIHRLSGTGGATVLVELLQNNVVVQTSNITNFNTTLVRTLVEGNTYKIRLSEL